MISYDAIPGGRTLAGRFVIESPLGHGRSATVYRALDLQTETRVALKVLDPGLVRDPVATRRFAREVQILRGLEHPNIIKVYAFLQDGPWSIICMEHFEGMDLKAHLERYGRMAVAELLAVATRAVSAVAACHRGGVLHRDLKPQNVLVDARHEVKVVDFGVARLGAASDLTRTGTILGTPQYLAPETFACSRPDPRSDVYALGAVLYEMLAGRPPYRASSLAEIMTAQLRAEIEPIAALRRDVPEWLEAVVLKCLRTDPGRRYQSCYELLRDLERGERSRARRERHEAPTACLHCREEILPGLPFCQQCGVFREIAHARGRHAVILHQCDDLERLGAFLERAFAIGRRAARLRPPAVLARGISRESAAGLAYQLSVVPSELRVTERPALQLDLPAAYAGLAALSLLPLFWAGASLSAAARTGLIAGAELLLVAAYWVRTRPVIRLGMLRGAGAPAAIDAPLGAMAERLARVGDRGLKAILGSLVRSFLELRARLARSPTVLDAAAIARAVLAALDAARVIETHEAYLARTSIGDLQAELRAVAGELAHASGRALAPLVERRAVLRRERRTYHAIQDLHARTYVAMLNLQALLQRIDDALGGDGAADAAAELGALEEALRAPTQDDEPAGVDDADEAGDAG